MKLMKNAAMMWNFYFALPELFKEKKDIYKYRDQNDYENERKHILKATSDWGKRVVKDFNINLEINGYENLPEKGPVLFVGNHQGIADIPICCSVLDKFQTGFIAKKGLEKIVLYGQWISNIRGIIIDRENPREAIKTMNIANEFIEKGFSLLIYPEGTRSRSSKISDFKRGSLRPAIKAGIPIVPFTINGSYKIFEEKEMFQKNQNVTFTIHKLVETKGLSKEEINSLNDNIYETVKSGL